MWALYSPLYFTYTETGKLSCTVLGREFKGFPTDWSGDSSTKKGSISRHYFS